MDKTDHQTVATLPAARRSRGWFWLWVTLFGILFSIGACAVGTFRHIEDRARGGLHVSSARQVLVVVHMYQSGHDQKAPDSLDQAFNDMSPDDGAKMLEDLQPEKGKLWHYFKPQDHDSDSRVVILVSPHFEWGHEWLIKRRVIGWSDLEVSLVRDNTEVPLPSGRTMKLSELP